MKQPASLTWPVPMRVMAWTDDGIVQIGMLPDRAPATYPEHWYIEPTQDLHGYLGDVVAMMQQEHIPGLSLVGQSHVPLEKLTALPELKALVLDDTDADLTKLTLDLDRLYVERVAIEDVNAVVAKLPHLQVLDLDGVEMHDTTAIAGLTELRALDLGHTQITDRDGAMLGALTKLEILDLAHTKIGAQTIAAIRPLALRELFIEGTMVGKEVATLDGYAPGIVRFDASDLMSEYRPTDRDVAWLAQAPNLVEVGLGHAKVHDALALQIFALPGLKEVRFADTEITKVPIAALAKRTEMREIDLGGTPVTDEPAKAMIAFPELRMLRLDSTKITDAAFTGVVPSSKLVELYVSGTDVTDLGMAVLSQLPDLRGLGVGTTKVKDATVERISHLDQLRTLVMSKVKVENTALIGRLAKLQRLYLDDCFVDDSMVAAFAKLTKLRALHLENTSVGEGSIAVLNTFTQLEELTVGDTYFGDTALKLDLPRLHTLSLVGLQIDDAHLQPALAHLAPVVELDLSATEVKDPSALLALTKLKVLGLAQTKVAPDVAKRFTARGVDVKM
ncbi:MAG: hypothetical protein QM831_13365 [Kofleriaceae bacterium]